MCSARRDCCLPALTDSLDNRRCPVRVHRFGPRTGYRGEWDRLGRLCATYAEHFDSTDYAVRRYAYLAQALPAVRPAK